MPRLGVPLVSAALLSLTAASPGPPWGSDGHEIVGLAAAAKLPQSMPAFFRDAAARLGYLNYEPDRWRSDGMAEANEAFRYDHYIDLEVIPDSALAAEDRFEFLALMQRNGMTAPERNAGLLPFAIMELYQRVVIAFGHWRAEPVAERKAWIEERILNDAGILGHYVADAANPHHTSVHHNGWAEGWPNPRGFSAERTFHHRFESEYLSAHLTVDDVLPLATAPIRVLTGLRAEVLAHIRRSHDQLERLYELEQQERFGRETRSSAHKRFTAERLAAAAVMLRDFWWSAWLESAGS